MILSNKGIAAVTAVFAQAGLADAVDLVLGDMPGVRRKPDPMAFVEIIAPWYANSRSKAGEGDLDGSVRGLKPEEVMGGGGYGCGCDVCEEYWGCGLLGGVWVWG